VWSDLEIQSVFFARVGLGLNGFVACDAWPSMLPGGYPAAQDFAGVRLGAAEGGFVNFAIRILRQHRAECAKGSRAGASVKWWINASNAPSETPDA
jgi:hypothetical protein